MSKPASHWLGLSSQEASNILYDLIIILLMKEEGYKVSLDQDIKVLTQRLYGDYRQVHMTNEYKRAEKEVRLVFSSPLIKVLK